MPHLFSSLPVRLSVGRRDAPNAPNAPTSLCAASPPHFWKMSSHRAKRNIHLIRVDSAWHLRNLILASDHPRAANSRKRVTLITSNNGIILIHHGQSSACLIGIFGRQQPLSPIDSIWCAFARSRSIGLKSEWFRLLRRLFPRARRGPPAPVDQSISTETFYVKCSSSSAHSSKCNKLQQRNLSFFMSVFFFRPETHCEISLISSDVAGGQTGGLVLGPLLRSLLRLRSAWLSRSPPPPPPLACFSRF